MDKLVKTAFIYDNIEDALNYSSYYSDVLTGYGNKFTTRLYITNDKTYLLEFYIRQKNGRKNIPRGSKRIGHLPKPGGEDS